MKFKVGDKVMFSDKYLERFEDKFTPEQLAEEKKLVMTVVAVDEDPREVWPFEVYMSDRNTTGLCSADELDFVL